MGSPITGDKNPILAAILNFCLFGCVGYFYMGQTKKGIVFLIAFVVLIFVGLSWAVCIFGAIDGYLQASVMKEGKAVGDFTFFKGEFKE